MEDRAPNNAESCERIYQNALLLFSGRLYSEAADEFARIPDYKDSSEKKLECEKLTEEARLDRIYADADKAAANMNVRSQEKAIKLFKTIPGWRDADDRIREAYTRIDEIIIKEKEDRVENIRRAEQEQIAAQKRKKRIKRSLLITAASAAALVLLMFLTQKVILPTIKYRKAVKLMEAGASDEAYSILHGLDFWDSNDLVRRMALEKLSDAEIGSTVQLGLFPQESEDSEDPIEWIVLDKQEGRLLLISKYALTSLPYQALDDGLSTFTWKTSQLCKWLNETFLNKAFDKGEAKLLAGMGQDSDAPVKKHIFGQEVIGDKVFLLSISDAYKYFPTDESRQCFPTRYAIKQGAYCSSVGGTCFWWLRTAVEHADESFEGNLTEVVIRAACVGTSGKVVDIGHYMFNYQYSVRPAIWVNIETGTEGAYTGAR